MLPTAVTSCYYVQFPAPCAFALWRTPFTVILCALPESMEPPTKKTRTTASRRSPYAAAACDHCHGRKLKCSGDRPCIRCKKQNLSCSYPTKNSSSSVTSRVDPSLSRRLPDEQTDGRVGRTLITNIDELQRQLDEFRSRLRNATASGPSESAFPSPPEAVLQFRRPEAADPKNDLSLLKPESDPAETIYAGPTSFAWGMVSVV